MRIGGERPGAISTSDTVSNELNARSGWGHCTKIIGSHVACLISSGAWRNAAGVGSQQRWGCLGFSLGFFGGCCFFSVQQQQQSLWADVEAQAWSTGTQQHQPTGTAINRVTR